MPSDGERRGRLVAPTITTIADPRIAYSTGWQQINDAAVSAGHFALTRSRNSHATLSFGVPASQFGSVARRMLRGSSTGVWFTS